MGDTYIVLEKIRVPGGICEPGELVVLSDTEETREMLQMGAVRRRTQADIEADAQRRIWARRREQRCMHGY